MQTDAQIGASESQEPNKVSKTQLKKQLRRAKYLEQRGERRKLEKEKRKLKRQERAKEATKLGQNGETQVAGRGRPKLMSESSNKFRIVIDMDFEDHMSSAETCKAVQQLGRIYSLNRHSSNPCQLYVSSLKGKIREQCATTNTGYQNWDINVSELDYKDIFESGSQNQSNSFVYLSGDSETTLPDVGDLLADESKIFVIGGLVDHNRHKNLCHSRALTRNIPTAKLPIKEYVTLNQRHILSTFAVFEILLHVLAERKTWPEALLSSIPKRKLAQPTATTLVDGTATELDAKDCDVNEIQND